VRVQVASWLVLTLAGCAHPEASEPAAQVNRPPSATQAVETPAWYVHRQSAGAADGSPDGGLSTVLGPPARASSAPRTSGQYFDSVKGTVASHWDPVKPWRERDPKGTLYAYKNRYVLLSIELDAAGKLLDAHVEKSSGLDFLDEAAVLAFKDSAFAKPPAALLKEGRVRFQFGFRMDFAGDDGGRLNGNVSGPGVRGPQSAGKGELRDDWQ
jgi:TonB family protein